MLSYPISALLVIPPPLPLLKAINWSDEPDGLDSSDRLKRYKFFGTKVCNALGFPENQWIYPSNFQLDDSGNNENFFQGDLNANSLFVRDEISF